MIGTSPSRTAARAAIVAYLMGKAATGAGGDGTIPYLSVVFPFPAKFTPEGELFAGDDPGTQNGAAIWLYIEPQNSERAPNQGKNPGGKFVTYPFALDIVFRSTKKKTQDAAADNELMLDGLIAAIEADKNAGTDDGTIWSWGEGGTNKGPDLDLTSYYPRSLNGAAAVTQINSRLVVKVLQYTTQ